MFNLSRHAFSTLVLVIPKHALIFNCSQVDSQIWKGLRKHMVRNRQPQRDYSRMR